jgi:hypothetical protein
MSQLVFEIVSPSPGGEVGRSVNFVVSAHDPDPAHFPKYHVDDVTVRLSAGGPARRASRDGSTWKATMTVPRQTTGGAELQYTVTASGSVNEGNDPGGGGPIIVPFAVPRDVLVVAETTFPDIGFDAYPHDVTVTTTPYALALTGTAFDASKVASVELTVDGAPVPVRDVSGDWTQWAADLALGFGEHPIEVSATDTFGNTGSRQESIIVREPPEPEPAEQAFAMTNYLQEVIGMAGRYIRVDGAASTNDDQANWLHQPLTRLIEPVNFAAASASVAQVRIAVEVLRRLLRSPAPPSLDRRYRAQAYDALLRELGASSEELRLARTADDPTRQALADRLGIELGGTRPDRLDTITIPPDEITDDDLEQLFGYRSTDPTDPLVTAQPATVSLWRQDALRAAWSRADAAERDGAAGPLPVIDPDVIVETHVRSQDKGDAAHRLWTQRRAWIDERMVEIADLLDRAAPTAAGFDTALRDAGLTADLAALAARDAAGVDITAELAVLRLTLGAFRYLVRIRALAATGTVTASERRDVASILVQVRKRRMFRKWRREERQTGIVLQPSTFVADVADDPGAFTGVLRWRADGATLARWRRTLTARESQAEASAAGYRAAIDAAEREVLPGLRDALIALIGRRNDPPRPPQQTAERLSRQLALDFRAAPGNPDHTGRPGRRLAADPAGVAALGPADQARRRGGDRRRRGPLRSRMGLAADLLAVAFGDGGLCLPGEPAAAEPIPERRHRRRPHTRANERIPDAARHGGQRRPRRHVPRDAGPGP